MKRTLRFFLLSLMAMFVTTAFAQKTVTFDFDNDYQTLFPTLPGTSSSSSHDGDFTEDAVAVIDGVYLAVSVAEEGNKTANRIWEKSPRLRMYSGTLNLTNLETPITKVEFVCKDKFNLTSVLSGTLDGKVWTGSDQMVSFQVNGNTQISSIIVTVGGEAGPEDPDDPDDPFNPADFISKYQITLGEIIENDNQLTFNFKGVISEVDVTGQLVLGFENDLCNSCVVSITFPTELYAMVAYEGIKADSESTYKNLKLDGKTISAETDDFSGISKIAFKSMMKIALDNEKTGSGTLTDPLSPNMANVYASDLKSGEVTEYDVYVKGKIASIKYEFSAQYGTATFFISADGKDDFTFQAYSVLYLENKAWEEGNTQIKVGDEVIICGKLTNYKGTTPETASKQAYIYSLNGNTKNEKGDKPEPQVSAITVAKALEIINALGDGETTSEKYQVKGFVVGAPDFQRKGDGSLYGNVNFTMADEKGGTSLLTVYRAKGYDNQNFTEETIALLKEGDEVVIEGQLQKYVKGEDTTLEIKNCYVISINGQSSSVEALKAETDVNAPAYNLSGQKVAAGYRGIVVKNGKKFLSK